MRVYISNYSSMRGRPTVQISKTSPSWAVIKKSIPELFPSWDLIQLIKTTKVGSRERREAELEYVKRYTRQLIINRDSSLMHIGACMVKVQRVDRLGSTLLQFSCFIRRKRGIKYV